MAIEQLPGLSSVMREGGLRISQSPNYTTDSVLLIGTATDGPKDSVVRVSRLEEATRLFGSYVDETGLHNGATLIPAILQAWDSGCRNIYAVRITGEYSSLALKSDEPKEQIVIKGRYPGSKYDAIEVSVGDDVLSVWSIGAGVTATATYDLTEYSNYGKLMDAFNRDASLHGARMEMATGIGRTAAIDLDDLAKTPLADGDDGLEEDIGAYDNSSTYRGMLRATYENLTGQDFNFVVPLGVAINPAVSTVDPDASELAEFCKRQVAENGISTLGVIGVQPIGTNDLTEIGTLVTNLLAKTNVYEVDGEDIGKYISIVAGEALFFDNQLGHYYDSPAVAYGAYVSQLADHSSPIFKVIPSIQALRYNFTDRDAKALSDHGIVTLKNRRGRGIVVNDDPTAAKRSPLSDYSTLTIMRIVAKTVDAIRTVGDPYIGEAMTAQRRDALITDIDSVLAARKERGSIQDYRFELTGTVSEQIQGIFTVELDLVPAFTLRVLRVRVALRRELTGNN